MSDSNRVVSGQAYRQAILAGVDICAIANQTLGPAGKSVVVGGLGGGVPHVTKDGKNVLSQLSVPRHEDVAPIVDILRQSSFKTNDHAGDGTTTANVIVGSAVRKVGQYITEGLAVADLCAGMNKACNFVTEYIKSKARPVASEAEVANVGTISANGNKAVGEIISEAMSKVGKHGQITVEEGKSFKDIEFEVVMGMSFDRGLLSSYFANNLEKGIAELDNPYVLLINKKITSIHPMVKLLDQALQSQSSLLIIAEDVEGEALTALVLNKLRGHLRVVPVKAPGFGDRRAAMLEDIRVITGAKHIVSDETGVTFDSLSLEDLGRAKSAVITQGHTTIIGGAGTDAEVQIRVNKLKNDMQAPSVSSYDLERLQERMAKITGGVAVLKVGGPTELAMKELKDRVEDALHATRAAVEEGVVPGGGSLFLYASKALENQLSLCVNEGEKAGFLVVKHALTAPINQILNNGGFDAQVIIHNLLQECKNESIFDARNGEYVNAFKKGIVDPAKVLRVALESAISVACTLISSCALMVDLPKTDSPDGSGGMGGMPGGMGGMGF